MHESYNEGNNTADQKEIKIKKGSIEMPAPESNIDYCAASRMPLEINAVAVRISRNYSIKAKPVSSYQGNILSLYETKCIQSETAINSSLKQSMQHRLNRLTSEATLLLLHHDTKFCSADSFPIASNRVAD